MEIAQTAMDQFNCTIIPSNMDGFENVMREPSIACLQGISLKLVDGVIFSSTFMEKIKQWARPFNNYDGPEHEAYVDLGKELGEMRYDAASADDVVGEEVRRSEEQRQ